MLGSAAILTSGISASMKNLLNVKTYWSKRLDNNESLAFGEDSIYPKLLPGLENIESRTYGMHTINRVLEKRGNKIAHSFAGINPFGAYMYVIGKKL